MVENEIPETAQVAEGWWDRPREAGVGEVEDGEEREVTDVGAHLSQQGNVRQNKSGDALPAPAARDADPAAEGHVLSPAMAKDAERVGELGFEGK